MDIPGYDKGDLHDAFEVFTIDNTVSLCEKVLGKVEDYEQIILHAGSEGLSLGLAWRMETRLDWVRYSDDVRGKFREWAVLYGLALKQVGHQGRETGQLQPSEHLCRARFPPISNCDCKNTALRVCA